VPAQQHGRQQATPCAWRLPAAYAEEKATTMKTGTQLNHLQPDVAVSIILNDDEVFFVNFLKDREGTMTLSQALAEYVREYSPRSGEEDARWRTAEHLAVAERLGFILSKPDGSYEIDLTRQFHDDPTTRYHLSSSGLFPSYECEVV
jgi:hypothetical protein